MKNNIIAVVGHNGNYPLHSAFKNVQTKEVTTFVPENTVFEIVNKRSFLEPKSGRENRRERRKQNRKNK